MLCLDNQNNIKESGKRFSVTQLRINENNVEARSVPAIVPTVVQRKTAMDLFPQKLKMMTLLRFPFSKGSIVLSQECQYER